MKKQAKFGIGIGVIVVSMAFLAWLGYGESKTYYHTLAELDTLKGSERTERMRIGGTVQNGSRAGGVRLARGAGASLTAAAAGGLNRKRTQGSQ